MKRIFIEENNIYKIDCSNSIWATDELNNIYHSAKLDLSDVDFIFETNSNIILVEYKNANISVAVKPHLFNPVEDKKIQSIIKKFYDSYIYLNAIQKIKPKIYVYILEYPNGSIITRKFLRNRISKKLPFNLQNREEISINIIDAFYVLSIDEWNSHKEFMNFPISILR